MSKAAPLHSYPTTDQEDRLVAPMQISGWFRRKVLQLRSTLNRYPLVWFAIAWGLGSLLGRLQYIPLSWNNILAALFCLGALTSSLGRLRYATSATTFLAVVLTASSLASILAPPSADDLSVFAERASQPIAVQGVVESAAVWRPNPNRHPGDPTGEQWQTQWWVRWDALRDQDQWRTVSARATLSTEGRIIDFLPGDRIEVFGQFRSIYPPTNPGSFDYAKHAQSLGAFVRVQTDSVRQIRRIGIDQSYWLQRARGYAIRQIDTTLHRWVTRDQAPLAAALVFGQREQVDWEDQQELMATGTLHLLAISGMHVEIIASALFTLCLILAIRPKYTLIVVVGICCVYTALAGGKPPVLRAVILVAGFSIARYFGRKPRLGNLLGLAAIVLLSIRATNLENVGVQLSFLAVACIGVFAIDSGTLTQRRSALQAVIEESFSRWQRLGMFIVRGFTSAWRISFWVWLITCPLVWSQFHIVAPISILLNIVLSIPLMIGMLGGLLTATLGWIPPIGWIAGHITGSSLGLISWLVAVGKSLPLSHLWLPAPAMWWTIVFYAATLVWLVIFGTQRRMELAWLLLSWIGIGILSFAFGPRGYLGGGSWSHEPAEPEMRCTFLDVGHGTCVILELPTGEIWLYDAGHLGSTDKSHQEIATALWSLPTSRIDTLILSHADSDHYNATRGLMERFSIGRVVSTERFWQSSAREVQQIHIGLEQHGVQRESWNNTAHGMVGNLKWQVLHPRDALQADSDNASSLCLLVEFGGKRLLLPGDLEGSGLLDLTALPDRPCHILMAPHHGSLTNDPSELLKWCIPQTVVVSGNHRAVRSAVQQQYSSVPQFGITFRDGAIQVRIAEDGTISVWRMFEQNWIPLD